MAESEGIQEIVNQAAIQMVTSVIMTLRDADAGPKLAPTASPRGPQTHWHGRPKEKCLHSVRMARTSILSYLTLRWKSQRFLKQKDIKQLTNKSSH